MSEFAKAIEESRRAGIMRILAHDMIPQWPELMIVFEKDEHSKIIFVNNNWLEAFGYTMSEACEHGFWHYMHPADRQRTMDYYMKSISDPTLGLKYEPFCNRYQTKSGDTLHIEWFYAIEIAEDSPYSIGTCRVVSEAHYQAWMDKHEKSP